MRFISCALPGAIVLIGAALAQCSPSDPMNQEGSPSDRMTREEARERLDAIVKRIKPVQSARPHPERFPDRSAKTSSIADALPDISYYDLVVNPPVMKSDVVAEILTSTEKSGPGTDGWMNSVAQDFNQRGIVLSDGRTAKIRIRHIPSGVAYQFIASGKYRPDAYSPSNHLWIEMVKARVPAMTPVRESLVPNLVGIVVKEQDAAQLRTEQGALDIKKLVDAVIQRGFRFGYTDPFMSSAGLNFLISVLQKYSAGDESRLLDSAVASSFEEFQRHVAKVALTTLEMRRDLVDERARERENSLDAFVMEWQTFTNDSDLKSGYVFVPFGARHDNPLYAVGFPRPEILEVLRLFAASVEDPRHVAQAKKFGFDPPRFQPEYAPPGGDLIIQAQNLWKEKKDAGRKIAAVFLCDVSGSMQGTRIRGVRRALETASGMIKSDTAIGVATFSDRVQIMLPLGDADGLQKSALLKAAKKMQAVGETAMYDGVAVALWMLDQARQAAEEEKENAMLFTPKLIVLGDGQPTERPEFTRFEELRPIIRALGVSIHTIGYEADLEELRKISDLVEGGSSDANKDDIAYTLSTLFNLQM